MGIAQGNYEATPDSAVALRRTFPPRTYAPATAGSALGSSA
jgi:hypothetical protein